MTAINFPSSPSNGDTFVAGSVTYTYNSTKQYWDALPTAPLNTNFFAGVTQHITPGTDNTYDLGSSTHKWRSLYVDAGTINIGSQTIKATSSGIQLPEVTIGTGTTTIKLGVDASGNLKQTPTVSGTAGSEVQTVSLTDLSATTASAGTAGLAYNNTTGAFTYTPTDISTKADIAGPTFTGVASAVTASTTTNTTQLATTAFVQQEITALVDSAPGTLNTLNELAAALGDDASFSTTITNSIAAKAPLAAPTFTGVPAAPTASAGTNTTQLATTAFVTAATAGSGGSGGSIDLVADGTIAAGKAVTIEAGTGKVKQIASTTSNFSAHGYKYSIGRGISTIFGNTTTSNSNAHNHMYYDDSIDRIIYLTSQGYVGAGAINDSTGTVTWTNNLTLPSSLGGNVYNSRARGFYNSTLNRSIIVAYDNTADKLEGMQYTMGPSSATQNVSAVLLTGSDVVDWAAAETFLHYPITGTNKFILVYTGTSYAARLNIVEATASGFTVGTAITPTSDNQRTGSANTFYMGHSSGYSSHSGKGYYLFYRASDGRFVYDTFDVSGASPVLDSNIRTTAITGATYINNNTQLHVEGKYAIITTVGQNGKAYVFTGEINSSTGDITFAGTPKEGLSADAFSSTTKAVFVGPVGSGYFAVSSGGATSGSSQPLYYMDGKIGANGALTVGRDWYAQSTVSSGAIIQNGGLSIFNVMGRNKSTGKVIQVAASSVAIYGATSWATHHFVYTPNYVGASNSSEWVGINTTAKTDGQTATITLPGGINENQSGMTIEGAYYVQDNGDITTTATDYKAGVALTASKILVDDNTVNGATNLSAYATTSALTTGLAAKASLAGPTFTGVPAAPTASAGTNTTQLATTAFVAAATAGSGGSSSIDLTADGAIGAGKAVTLEAATGKVKQVFINPADDGGIGTDGDAPTYHSQSSYTWFDRNSSPEGWSTAYDSTNNFGIEVYTEYDPNFLGYNVISGMGGNVTTVSRGSLGQTVTSEVTAGGHTRLYAIYDPTQEKYIVLYDRNNNTARYMVGTPNASNGSVSWGSPVSLPNNRNAGNGDSCFEPSTGHFITRWGSSSDTTMNVGSFDGSTFTWTETAMGESYTNFVPFGDGRVLCWKTETGKARIATIAADRSVTFGTAFTSSLASSIFAQGGSGRWALDAGNNRLVMVYADTSSRNLIKAAGGTISGTTISGVSSPTTISTLGSHNYASPEIHWIEHDSSNAGNYMLAHNNSGNNSYTASTYLLTLSFDGSTITAGTNDQVYIKTGGDSGSFKIEYEAYPMTFMGGSVNRMLWHYTRRNAVSGDRRHSIASIKMSATSNKSEWVGINTTAASDGGTATITLPGGLNENQSGMTIEGTYYVQDDGDIETGVTSEAAGVAASATQLLVADNTANASQNVGSYASNASVAAKAPLASPALTGTPTAPTASVGTNTTQIATTAFVLANGSTGTTYSEITSATTAVAGNVYIINTGAAVTLTLPASASIGDKVGVIDGTGQAATNNITIGRNSHKIQGDAADMTVSLNRAAFELVYYNATHGWLLTKV